MNTLDKPVGQWSKPLRWLHLLLAIAITAQLFVGSFMHSPHHGRPDSVGFEVHETLGFTILVLVLLHWLWSYKHPNEGLRHLFPWTRSGLRSVYSELLQGVQQRRLLPGGPGKDGGLAGFVHGLGLLAVTGMVVSGSVFYFSRMSGVGSGALEIIEDIHDTLAVITWIYWGGHLAMTLVHSLMHHSTFSRMFDLTD